MLAVTAASAAVQNNIQNKSIEAQAAAANKNTASQLMAQQSSAEAAAEQAFEQRTDRARQAARQLATARVLSAQGGGSLASMAVNISGAEADDLSRIDASLENQQSTIRGQQGSVIGAAEAQNDAFDVQGRANQIGTGLKIANGVAQAGASYYGNVSQEGMAKKYGYNPYFSGTSA
jgi:hypothetical protein